MRIVDLIYGRNQIKCPRCGAKLSRDRLRRTSVNRCEKGCGLWIDQFQLDQISKTKSNRYEITDDLPANIPNQSTAS